MLLLDVPPDQRGHIDDADVARLREFGDWVRRTFTLNLARNATRHIDRSAADTTFTYDLTAAATFTIIALHERIEDGQRIARFTIDARIAKRWKTIAVGTTIGYKRLLQLESPVTATGLRIRIKETRDTAEIAGIGLYH